jgi:hypothetical protein
MAMTTDFDAWLEPINLETEEESGDLILSVTYVKTVGEFTTIMDKNGRFLVTGWTGDTLLLVGEVAQQAFIAEVKKIQTTLPDEDEAAFQRAMDDPKA